MHAGHVQREATNVGTASGARSMPPLESPHPHVMWSEDANNPWLANLGRSGKTSGDAACHRQLFAMQRAPLPYFADLRDWIAANRSP